MASAASSERTKCDIVGTKMCGAQLKVSVRQTETAQVATANKSGKQQRHCLAY